MLLRSACFVLTQILLDVTLSTGAEDLNTLLEISPQDRLAQEVADRCFSPGPCDAGAPYRTYDGSCNNLNFPMWGLTNSAVIRILPANYSDGKSLPRVAASGNPLPNARELQLRLIPEVKRRKDFAVWTLFLSWAQWVSHDTGHSTPKREGLSCCSPDGKILDPLSDLCFPIQVSDKDPFYSAFNVTCIDMFRARTVREFGCDLEIDQQSIDVTHFLDLSQVYASNKTVADTLRMFQGGLLRSQTHQGGQFPPQVGNPRETCALKKGIKDETCFLAGDKRVNQNIFLTPLHVVFLRTHNKIAAALSKINPHWNDEKIFQETRRIMIAIYQLITYNEFLPILVGENILKKLHLLIDPKQGHESGYDINLNPSTMSEFMNSAYRSLHTFIPPKVKLVPQKTMRTPPELELVDWMEQGFITKKFYPQLLRGQEIDFVEQYDKFEPTSINTKLFHFDKPWGSSLDSLSIQRQSEFGTQGYNGMRVYARLTRATDFDGFSDVMGKEEIELLRAAYGHVDDVDLFIGGLFEKPHNGGKVGIMFHKLIVEQFFRWKFGDRYFFTFGDQAGSFKPEQLAEILKLGSGWLFCQGDESIGSVHPNNMNNALPGNQLVPCSKLPKLDLTKWKENP